MTTAPVWMQFADEPNTWYDRFSQYYLPLGPGRTLLQAYIAFTKATDEDKSTLMTVRPPMSAPPTWTDASRMWDWRKRGTAWDASQVSELAHTLTAARQFIQQSTLDAAKTLHKALDNPKYAVAAAKEILDRGGVPAVTVHAIRTIPFTADDLALAAREVEEWQAQQLTQAAPKKGLVLNG